MIKSPLNYTGGKYKLLKHILPLFPRNINTFVDLFAGGCNVGINVNCNKVVFNDNLTYLINLYQVFKDNGYDLVLEHIENRIRQFDLTPLNLEGYNEMRKLYNKGKNPLDLFVLICYSFNHQIRFNNKHEFNCSFGKIKGSFNPSIKANLYDFVNKIVSPNIIFTNFDFMDFDFSNITPDDFVYIDPPYLITTGSYNDGKRGFKGWAEKEEYQLLNLIIELDKRGIRFALSNVLQHKGLSNEILIKFLDDNKFNVHYLDYTYYNCNYHTLNRDVDSSVEVLITNYKL